MRIFCASLLFLSAINGCKPPAGKSATSEVAIDKARMFCKEQLNKEFDINTYLYTYPPQNNEYTYCVDNIDQLEQAQSFDLLKQVIKFCEDQPNKTLDYKIWANDMKDYLDKAKEGGKVSPPKPIDSYCVSCGEGGDGKENRPCTKSSDTDQKPKQ